MDCLYLLKLMRIIIRDFCTSKYLKETVLVNLGLRHEVEARGPRGATIPWGKNET